MATIILLNGPPAAGKTTVSALFVKEQEPAEWAYISHDDVRQLVKSGYKSADDTREEWDEGTKRQWRVGAENCVDLAVNFAQAGISSVIDFYATKEEFVYWQELLKGMDFVHVLLLPGEVVALARNNARQYPARLSDKKIAESYEEFGDWSADGESIVLDNSTQTPGQTVERLIQLIG